MIRELLCVRPSAAWCRLLSQVACALMALMALAALSGCDEDEVENAQDNAAAMEDMASRLDLGPIKDQGDLIPDSRLDAQGDGLSLDLNVDLSDSGAEQEMGLGSECDEACALQRLEIALNGQTRALSRAVYGLTAPSSSSQGGGWEIYLEAYEGGDQGCPSDESATPRYTMIVSGLPIPQDLEPINKLSEPSLNAVLFDFDGDLIEGTSLWTRATNVTVSARALSVCTECVGQPAPSDQEGFVALTLTAQLEGGGLIEGELYASHCDSLDEPGEE